MAKQFTYDQLAIISPTNGFQRASQREMVKILSDKMRDIYGSDIDLNAASADAQYLMMETLIFDNMYSLLGNIANNLNPNTAIGQYLDILCQLTNIKRKPASQSKVNIYIKNVSGNSVTILRNNNIQVQDTNGYIWTFTPSNNITLANEEITLQTFICDEFGPITAAGTGQSITDPVTDIAWNSLTFNQNNGSFILMTYGTYKIYQAEDAVPGNIAESDTSLRLRQKRMSGINSYTTKEGLFSALYNLEYIDDCYIFSNNSASPTANIDDMTDGTITVAGHNVYIALRYKPNTIIDEDEIAQIINNRLTPGVITQSASGTTTGIATSKTVEGNTIYWKKCSPENNDIIIKYMCLPRYNVSFIIDDSNPSVKYVLYGNGTGYLSWTNDDGTTKLYSSTNLAAGDSLYTNSSLTTDSGKKITYVNYLAENEQEEYIKTILINYLNNIQIGQKLINNDVITELQQADLNTTSYIAQSMTVDGLEDNGENYCILPVTYFHYTTASFSYTIESGNIICTLIIG